MMLFSVLGVAAIGTWWKMRQANRNAVQPQPTVEVDDDTIADIIRRSLPAFERARILLVHNPAFGS